MFNDEYKLLCTPPPHAVWYPTCLLEAPSVPPSLFDFVVKALKCD